MKSVRGRKVRPYVPKRWDEYLAFYIKLIESHTNLPMVVIILVVDYHTQIPINVISHLLQFKMFPFVSQTSHSLVIDAFMGWSYLEKKWEKELRKTFTEGEKSKRIAFDRKISFLRYSWQITANYPVASLFERIQRLSALLDPDRLWTFHLTKLSLDNFGVAFLLAVIEELIPMLWFNKCWSLERAAKIANLALVISAMKGNQVHAFVSSFYKEWYRLHRINQKLELACFLIQELKKETYYQPKAKLEQSYNESRKDSLGVLTLRPETTKEEWSWEMFVSRFEILMKISDCRFLLEESEVSL